MNFIGATKLADVSLRVTSTGETARVIYNKRFALDN